MVKIANYPSPELRPEGLAKPRRLFPGIGPRPEALSRITADLHDIEMRPGTLSRPSASTRKQKRDYITGGYSVENEVLNLNHYNLIGVYGPPENREAMLMNPNGKITRLKVGSIFAKGRVIAINRDEMIYIRDNQNFVLKMNN